MHNYNIKNENGFVLIVTLLILVVLMLLGTAATNTTTIELHISGNEKVAKLNFYNAESKAMEGAQKLYDETNATKMLPELGNPADYIRSANATNDEDIEEREIKNIDRNNDGVIDASDFTDGIVVTLNGVSSGNSLGLETSRLYDYSAYGYSEGDNGKALIKVGIKKRF